MERNLGVSAQVKRSQCSGESWTMLLAPRAGCSMDAVGFGALGCQARHQHPVKKPNMFLLKGMCYHK